MTILFALPWLALAAGSASDLERGAAALAEFAPDVALEHLLRAREAGPYTHAEHVRLYESLGIAHAYLEHKTEAEAAFEMLLALDPGYAISYTLSPKATFAFERARRTARGKPTPLVDVAWPRGLSPADPVPITVEVVADPLGFFARAMLFHRVRGQEAFTEQPVALNGGGAYQTIVVPPPAPSAAEDLVLEVYLVALDARNSEVLRWGSPDSPREVSLRHVPESPWYGEWWVWAVGSVVVAGAAAGIVAYYVREEPADVPAALSSTW